MRQHLQALQSQRFDVAIVGGGINGTSAASRLASSGYRVLLVDRADFGSGSSSRSSRILHCGLNYLALAHASPTLKGKLANLSLAREMMQVRAELAKKLGARCRPSTFHIPLRAGDPPPWQIDAAFRVLRLLGGFDTPLNYRRWTRREMDADPALRQMGPDVRGVASFTEYVFDWPERICLDYVQEARARGAVVRNYTEVTAATADAQGWSLRLRDARSPDDTAQVSARLVFNLTGPWADATNAVFKHGLRPTVTPSKGCHLTLKLPPEFRGQGLINRNATGHLFICVPWGDLHILGPTETRFGDDARSVRPGADDVSLILASANSVLPGAGLSERDIVMKWAGVRPATYGEGAPHGLWQKAIHDHGTAAGAPLVSLSWGRIADHHLTADELSRIAQGKLGAAARAGGDGALASSPSDEAGEQAVTVADVLFRRTGRAWAGGVTVDEVRGVAQQLASATAQPADALVQEFLATMRDEFGRELARPAPACTIDADAEHQSIR